jgi:hypothetical protein
MKTKFKFFSYASVLLAAVIFVSSCSTSVDVAKRRYNSGYYVSISSGKTSDAYISKTKVNAVKPLPAATAVIGTETAADVFLRTSVPAASASDNALIASTEKTNVNALSAKAVSGKPSGNYERGKISFKEVKTFIKEQKKNIRDAKDAKGSKGGGKSQLVALLLCFFLGGLGIHRFYLGYTWQGIVQLLTGGGCGVWALIDFVRIIMGTLEPKDGGYSSTL